MAEEKQRLLYKIKPLTDRMPAVRRPEGHVHFRTKIMWVIVILLLYFAMTNIWLYGLDRTNVIDFFSSLRAILAGQQGSLMHLGIGPIVTGSIIMQLFAGAKIIKLDLSKDEDKAVYQGTQKLVVVIMIVVESVPQVFGFLTPSAAFALNMEGVWPGQGQSLALTIIVGQLIFGSYLVFIMDEVVSKWGIGSGISLFIAAGVAQQIFTGTFNWEPANPGPVSVSNPPAGTIPKTFYLLSVMPAGQLASGGIERILLGTPNPMVALVGTILIFFLVAYSESTRIELPLAHGQARGARGRYPIKLIYASVMPVILIAAVLANVSMFSLLFWQHPEWPLVGQQWWIGMYPDPSHPLVLSRQISTSTPIAGLAYYTQTLNGPTDWLMPMLDPVGYDVFLLGHSPAQLVFRILFYLVVFVGGCVLFSKFWIETTSMGPEDVAKQIERSGMQIPGFRRDPRVLRRVLARYIPVVTIIGGAAVGALAAGADMIGTVGQASGTGVLLAVGIMIQFYEAVGKEQMMEMHPVLRQFFGVE